VEESAESLVFGIGRVLAGRDLDGVKRTDATFWRSGRCHVGYGVGGSSG
jgi:hypothetical protein